MTLTPEEHKAAIELANGITTGKIALSQTDDSRAAIELARALLDRNAEVERLTRERDEALEEIAKLGWPRGEYLSAKKDAERLFNENSTLRSELETVKRGLGESRVQEMRNYLKSPAMQTFVDLKHSQAGTVLAMLGDGAISRGKCCEALSQLAHGVPFDEIPLPKENGRQFSLDEIPAEVVGKLEAELSALRTRLETAETGRRVEFRATWEWLSALTEKWQGPQPAIGTRATLEEIRAELAILKERFQGRFRNVVIERRNKATAWVSIDAAMSATQPEEKP